MRGRVARPGLVALFGRPLVEVEDQPAPLEPVLAPVDADAGQPGLEARPSPEFVQVLVGAQEALLGGAVGFPEIPQHPVGDARDLALVATDEVLEGLRLPGADLGDQPGLVHAGVGLPRNHRQSVHMD